MAVFIKPGVDLSLMAPGGMRLLEALKATSKTLGFDLTITCGREDHPPTDPHAEGLALDIRTHGFSEAQKGLVLNELMHQLQRGSLDMPVEVSGGLATASFWGWIEHPGQPDEHCHVQARKGTTYRIEDYLNA